jgi:CheY-like chemotaxis protein
MDVRMPKVTGYEACKALKKEEKTKDIPIIFLSAKGQETEISTGLELGAEEYFLNLCPRGAYRQVNKVLTKYGKL